MQRVAARVHYCDAAGRVDVTFVLVTVVKDLDVIGFSPMQFQEHVVEGALGAMADFLAQVPVPPRNPPTPPLTQHSILSETHDQAHLPTPTQPQPALRSGPTAPRFPNSPTSLSGPSAASRRRVLIYESPISYCFYGTLYEI